ncbi:hypothetical protein HJFPF1_00925 [Paramyrothecium foliicola]|nr:hypothetical protein HJFPF1_00925 [Paramyrothecium foliicola]
MAPRDSRARRGVRGTGMVKKVGKEGKSSDQAAVVETEAETEARQEEKQEKRRAKRVGRREREKGWQNSARYAWAGR